MHNNVGGTLSSFWPNNIIMDSIVLCQHAGWTRTGTVEQQRCDCGEISAHKYNNVTITLCLVM